MVTSDVIRQTRFTLPVKPFITCDRFYAEWAFQNQRLIKKIAAAMTNKSPDDIKPNSELFAQWAMALYIQSPEWAEGRDN